MLGALSLPGLALLMISAIAVMAWLIFKPARIVKGLAAKPEKLRRRTPRRPGL